MKKIGILLGIILHCVHTTEAQDFYPLWPVGKKPNANGIEITDSIYNERIWRVATPGIYALPATKSENTGTAVLICPGGGYERLSYIYNGFNFARWYNTLGINVFVLINRLPHQADLINKQMAAIQDAQRAIRFIRANAVKWNLKTDKIGTMGISAGGHVAAMLGTSTQDISAVKDSLDKVDFKPNFMVLLSPVITMGTEAHAGSKKNLLGSDTTKANIERYSAEKQVTSQTPPTFIVHAANDKTVKVQNSLLFYQALLEKSVEASIHVFPQGGHGIRLDHNPGSTDLWLDLLEAWLKEMSFVTPIPFK